MIRAVRRKLKNNTGASLMVALLFFIVCAVVGSVILAAASSSMGRMSRIESGDQNRYATQSAARLVKKQIEDAEYTNTYIVGNEWIRDNSAAANLSDVVEKMADQVLAEYQSQIDSKGTVIFNGNESQSDKDENLVGTNFPWTVNNDNDSSAPLNESFTMKLSNSGNTVDSLKEYNTDVQIKMNNSLGMTIYIHPSTNDNAADSSVNENAAAIRLEAVPFFNVRYDQILPSTSTEDDGTVLSASTPDGGAVSPSPAPDDGTEEQPVVQVSIDVTWTVNLQPGSGTKTNS